MSRSADADEGAAVTERVPVWIETERLRLRPLAEGDVERLHAIYGDAETMRYIGSAGRPTPDVDATRRTLGVLLDHGVQHGFTLWAIDERDGDPVVGVAGLLLVEGRGPEVEAAYLVRRDRWGRGYATEALRAVLGIAESLQLERVIALAYPGNEASRRVMEKAGMIPDGTVTAYGHEMTRHAWSPPGG
jgi:RimJ/RimL family protein N-acetyltransferase